MLGDGHVDDLVGVDERREDRPLVEHVALEAHRAEAVLRGQDDVGARASYAARQMPERWKQRFGSLHEPSATTTFLAPASNASRMTAATTSGLVFAAWMGMRSQPMFGLTTTTSPRETNLPMPPIASTARRTSCSGVAVGSGESSPASLAAARAMASSACSASRSAMR